MTNPIDVMPQVQATMSEALHKIPDHGDGVRAAVITVCLDTAKRLAATEETVDFRKFRAENFYQAADELVVHSIQKVPTGIFKTWPHTIDLGHNGRNQMMWSYHSPARSGSPCLRMACRPSPQPPTSLLNIGSAGRPFRHGDEVWHHAWPATPRGCRNRR